MTAFDVGANAGYFTLLMATYAGPNGHVIAFEPEPTNVERLQHHLRLNAVNNCELIEAAVADKDGVDRFDGSDSMGRLSATGSREVRTVRLDNYLAPDLIKMDIEGGEVTALAGANRILSERRTVWIVSTHAKSAWQACDEVFQNCKYSVERVGSDSIIARPKQALTGTYFRGSVSGPIMS